MIVIAVVCSTCVPTKLWVILALKLGADHRDVVTSDLDGALPLKARGRSKGGSKKNQSSVLKDLHSVENSSLKVMCREGKYCGRSICRWENVG
jgi:hypothetical protein